MPLSLRARSKCWSDKDQPVVTQIIKHVYGQLLNETIRTLPLFGLGVANGAIFMGSYAARAKEYLGRSLSAIALMNGGRVCVGVFMCLCVRVCVCVAGAKRFFHWGERGGSVLFNNAF